MENIIIEVKPTVNPEDFNLGVLVCRMQVKELHTAHIALIDKVCENHKKVIIFLGVPVVENTRQNPLDFATRQQMIQERYPRVTVLPLKDQRSNKKWSEILDAQINIPYGRQTALLYGGRDSFIPYYEGKNPVVELVTNVFYSGTASRLETSKEILTTNDFRAGIIHANYAKRHTTYPTVDIVAYNDRNEILLAKKPNEDKYRFIGGFVDTTDTSLEFAARREFIEETGNCEIGMLDYVCSGKINDWRYPYKEEGIMSTLFIGKFLFGSIQPSDDIDVLAWIDLTELKKHDKTNTLETFMMPEHVDFMKKLLKKI